MYCPQCGQQQSSEEMRFCSRCGFPLGGIAQLLMNGGLPATQTNESVSNKLSPRRRGVRQGTLLIIIGAILTPILGIISSYAHDHLSDVLTAISAIIFFLGGFLRILYAMLFEESAPPTDQQQAFQPSTGTPLNVAQLNTPQPRGTALPSHTGVPVSSWKPSPARTAEIVSPPSVTENTTRLLETKPDQSSTH